MYLRWCGEKNEPREEEGSHSIFPWWRGQTWDRHPSGVF